jgi:hypothetical protein
MKPLHWLLAAAVMGLTAVGFDARGDGPTVAAEQVRVNTAKWSEVVARAGIKAEP